MGALTIHIGAHRTASSSAQVSLRTLHEAGGLPGWNVFEPTQMRERFTRAAELASRFPILARPFTIRQMAPEVAAALRDEHLATLISDENFLGRADDCFEGDADFYPHAHRNLRALKRLTGSVPARVVLSVRGYATWWPSAYALLGIRRDIPEITELVPDWMQVARRWPEVVADAMAVFDTCDVVCFEALANDPLTLAKALVGEAAGAAKVFHRQPSFSGEALNALKDARTGDGAPDAEIMQAIRRQDRGRARLSPFSEDQIAVLNARYRDDLTKIAATGARIIAPPPDWPAY